MKPLLFCLLLPLAAISQNDITVAKDTVIKKELALVLSNDSIIQVGSRIKCGRGTLPNGNFKYIHTSASSWAVYANGLSAITPIGRQYSGLFLTVKSVKKEGNNKRGYKYLLKVGGGSIVNYDCEIADAIATGEIAEQSRAVASTATQLAPSSADELKKLKDLFDSGALTKEEYDSAKKKVLAKM